MARNGLSAQWGWSEMEDLLQCPVCFDPPKSGVVEQCKFGHHICSVCKPKVESCPLCKCSYTGTRNFVVEELMRNFEIIKNTMLLSSIAVEEKKSKKCEKKEKVPPPVVIPVNPRPVLSTPSASRGVYPCGFRQCDKLLPVCRILNHVKSYHSNFFIEGTLENNMTFSSTFVLNTVAKIPIHTWQKAIFVSGIGLVFFTFELLKIGFGIISVQMATQLKVSDKFKGVIRVSGGNVDYMFITKIVSTRDKLQNMLHKDSCMVMDRQMMKNASTSKKLLCTLELSPVSGGDRFGCNFTPVCISYYPNIISFYNGNRGSSSRPS